MSNSFQQIIESIQVKNPWESYEKLEAELEIGFSRNDHGSINEALDKAETNARRAHHLLSTAKLERARWEIDNDAQWSRIKTEAQAELQREKDVGKRSKMITEGDISVRIATMFPEIWLQSERKRSEMKVLEESMTNLVELWVSRCRSLQTMLAKSR